MKLLTRFSVLLLSAFLIAPAWAQQPDAAQSRQELLDTKLELMDAKLELLESRTHKLSERERLLDSLVQRYKQPSGSPVTTQQQAVKPDTISRPAYRTAIKMHPARLFEGTFQLTYERNIRKTFTVDVGLMGTYVTRRGLGGRYLADQTFSHQFAASGPFVPLTGEMLSGWGVMVQLRHYLLPQTGSGINPPLGLYAGPQLMYRNIEITGQSYWEGEPVTITKYLDIFRAGVILGGKFAISEVFCVDIFAGGVMRLSKYAREDGLTKYKEWHQIDYSGVLPTAGLSIGILK